MVSPKSPSLLRLLVAEDSEDDYEILLRELRRGGYALDAERIASKQALLGALERTWDLLISDWALPGLGGLTVIETVVDTGRDLPCIVVSGTPDEEAAVAALRAGALDFLSKDKPGRFVPAVDRVLRDAADRRLRRGVERELRFSEERYRTAFEIAPEALVTVDLERHAIVDANPAALQLFGATLTEMRAYKLPADYIERAFRGDSSVFMRELEIGDGTVPVETRVIRLPTTNAQLARISIVDLRERLKVQEIARRTTELENQNRRIQEANRLKSEFLANMSHELRTPLNAIIGFAELLHDGHVEPSTPQHTEFLGDILTSGRHLLQLINDVLDLAKVESGKLVFKPEPVDPGRVVGEVVAILRTTAATKRIRIDVFVDPSLGQVTIDPGRFKQVAYNYLSNALKFTPEGGRVTLRLRPDGDAFLFEVEDTGIGIAPADVGKLFVEFQQLEPGTGKRHQGTGLGLALTKRLVEAQGGSVDVRSTPGSGSVFSASLPRMARRQTETQPVRKLPAPAGARRVLVVEDDVSDQAMLVTTLANAGYAVETASTGAEALTRWHAQRFDAATIDLLLPDMSGLDLLAALHGDGRKSNIPIIVVTVVPDAKVVAGFAVHDILHKPLDQQSLLASLSRAGVQSRPEEV